MDQQELIDAIYLIIFFMMAGYIMVLHGQINGLRRHIEYFKSKNNNSMMFESKTTTYYNDDKKGGKK